MIVITRIEQATRAAGACPSVVFHALLPDKRTARYLIDSDSIRLLGSPASKAVILRKSVAKVVIATHDGGAFSILLYLRKGLSTRLRDRFRRALESNGDEIPTEIGTFFGGTDHAEEIGRLLTGLGYSVEYVELSAHA
jgi:hypothetical protein